LPAASLPSTSQLLVLGLGVVDGWVLSEDEMRAPEFINEDFALFFRVEMPLLLIACTNLLSQCYVSHCFNSSCSFFS